MKTTSRLSVHPARFLDFPRHRQCITLLLLLLPVGVRALYFHAFEALPQPRTFTVGAGAELVNTLALLFMFWVVQCAQLHKKTYLVLSAGLGIWFISGTLDVMDESRLQPWWVSSCEDSLRTLGMLTTAWGVLLLMRQMHRAHAQVASLALSDELTELSNRRAFRSALTEQAGVGTPLILLDLDHFKQINDRHGHDCGDNVLREFGCLLRELCPPGVLAARMGGEEFAIWLPKVSPAQAGALAERIRAATAERASSDGIHFTVSLGLGVLRAGEEVGELMKRTDAALYRAKHQGRNRVVQDD